MLRSNQRTSLWLLLAVMLVGCGGDDEPTDAPTVYPASGTVKKSDGTAVGGGNVSLRLLDGSGPSVNGKIETDGKFVLKTITAGGAVVEGAPEGNYLVTITPDFSQDQTSTSGPPQQPAQLPAPIEITAAGPNEFELIAP